MVSVLALDPEGVYWIVQLAVVPIVFGSAQAPGTSVPVNVPDPLDVKATAPFGVLAPAIPEESVTVAVQVVVDPELTDVGLHETVVVVGRRLTVILVLPVLPLWFESPE